MIGCLRTRVRKQPIIAFYFESENELKFYNLEAWNHAVEFIICVHDPIFKVMVELWSYLTDYHQ